MSFHLLVQLLIHQNLGHGSCSKYVVSTIDQIILCPVCFFSSDKVKMKFTRLKLFQASLIFKRYLLGPIIFDHEEK